MTHEIPLSDLTPNGKVYVTRSVNRYLPAHRDDNGTVRVVRTAMHRNLSDELEISRTWSTKGVCEETFIAD